MAKLNLSAPWVEFYNEVCAMFKYDPEVHVVLDDEHYEMYLYVDEAAKAAALEKLLPTEKDFGNVKLKITVVPANDEKIEEVRDIYSVAFYGNPVLSFIKNVRGVFDNDLKYVVFRKEVVQYWVDDLGDIYGQRSTLYQEIAKDIFEGQQGVFFCTDTEDPKRYLGNPLGEWP